MTSVLSQPEKGADVANSAINPARIKDAEEQLRMLRLAQGVVEQSWLEAKMRAVITFAMEESDDATPEYYTATEYLRDLGVNGSTFRLVADKFSAAVADLYREHRGANPPKIERSVDGEAQEVYGYTDRDHRIFVQAWTQIFRTGGAR